MRTLGFARSLARDRRRRTAGWGVAFSLLAAVVSFQPAHAADFQIEARTRYGYGWSGYWWPMLAGNGDQLFATQGPYTPLLKYAQLTGDVGPLQWERQYGYTTDPSATWWGHCNGWAAASILEPEPTREMRVQLQAGSPVVDFNVGEIKGLLAICHQGDPADFFSGGRHDMGDDYRTDLRALAFHKALYFYLYQRKEGVIFNITPKPEVWNFPCFAFRMRGQTDSSRPDLTWVTTTIWYADDDVDPNYVGVQILWATYTYVLQGDWKAPQAAEWTGSSVRDHPQFVWHPGYARAYDPSAQAPNPIRYDIVRALARLSAGVSATTAAGQ